MPSMEAECVLVEEVQWSRKKQTVTQASEYPDQPMPEFGDCSDHQEEELGEDSVFSEPESQEVLDDALIVEPVAVKPETECPQQTQTRFRRSQANPCCLNESYS